MVGNMFRVVSVGLIIVAFLSLNAFALPTLSQVDAEQADVLLPVPSFLLAIVSVPTADVVEPPTIATHITSYQEPRALVSRGSSSSLTVSEMHLVMGGGKNYNFITKSWGYRDAFRGQMRNNFILSWEAHRKISNVNQLIPNNELFSKE